MNDYNTLFSLLRSGLPRPASSSTPSLRSILTPVIKANLSQPRSTLPDAAQRFLNSPTYQPIPLPKRLPILRITPTTEEGLIKRISADTARIVKSQLQLTKAQKIPEINDVPYDEARVLQTSVLHIDIRDSSNIVSLCGGHINALKIYKIFHASTVSIARFQGGRIRTFAGDRLAVLFDIDKLQRTRAVETALLMQSAIEQILNPILSQEFLYFLDYGIGIDFGEMLVGRIGQYGASNNDLVWTGKATNFASKLADYGSGIFISPEVYSKMDKALRENFGMMWQQVNDSQLGVFYKFTGITKSLA